MIMVMTLQDNVNISRNFLLGFEKIGQSYYDKEDYESVFEGIANLRDFENRMSLFEEISLIIADETAKLTGELSGIFSDVMSETVINENDILLFPGLNKDQIKNNIFYWGKRLDKDGRSKIDPSGISSNVRERLFLSNAKNSWRESFQMTLEEHEKNFPKKDRNLDPWIRVAHPGACSFCQMLATRGTIIGGKVSGSAYTSRESALRTNKGKKYHDNCRCTAISARNILNDK